jgi:VanZ family protein
LSQAGLQDPVSTRASLRNPLIWLPPALWALLIFCLSTNVGSEANTHSRLFEFLALFWPGVKSLPLARQFAIEFCIRKGAHLTVYCVFDLLLCRAFYAGGTALPRSAKWAWLIGAAYAATDEYHQTFFPSRTPQAKDVGIDALGGLVGVTLFYLWTRARNKRRD